MSVHSLGRKCIKIKENFRYFHKVPIQPFISCSRTLKVVFHSVDRGRRNKFNKSDFKRKDNAMKWCINDRILSYELQFKLWNEFDEYKSECLLQTALCEPQASTVSTSLVAT